jgi:hypothetical protein
MWRQKLQLGKPSGSRLRVSMETDNSGLFAQRSHSASPQTWRFEVRGGRRDIIFKKYVLVLVLAT